MKKLLVMLTLLTAYTASFGSQQNDFYLIGSNPAVGKFLSENELGLIQTISPYLVTSCVGTNLPVVYLVKITGINEINANCSFYVHVGPASGHCTNSPERVVGAPYNLSCN